MTNEIVNKIIEELDTASGPVPLARLGGEHAALVAYENLAGTRFRQGLLHALVVAWPELSDPDRVRTGPPGSLRPDTQPAGTGRTCRSRAPAPSGTGNCPQAHQNPAQPCGRPGDTRHGSSRGSSAS